MKLARSREIRRNELTSRLMYRLQNCDFILTDLHIEQYKQVNRSVQFNFRYKFEILDTVGKNFIRKRERVMVNAFTVCFWQERSKIIQYNLRFRLDLHSGPALQYLKYLKFPSPFLSFRNTKNFVINWKCLREKSEVKKIICQLKCQIAVTAYQHERGMSRRRFLPNTF